MSSNCCVWNGKDWSFTHLKEWYSKCLWAPSRGYGAVGQGLSVNIEKLLKRNAFEGHYIATYR